MKPCPHCASESLKVIYYGLPHRLCSNEQCNALFGSCAALTQWLPFNGYFLAYDDGYLSALWAWIKDE